MPQLSHLSAGVTLRCTFPMLHRVSQQRQAPVTCIATGLILALHWLLPCPPPTGQGVMGSPPQLITCTGILILGSASGGPQTKAAPKTASAFLAATSRCRFVLILQSDKSPTLYSRQLRPSHTYLMLCLFSY